MFRLPAEHSAAYDLTLHIMSCASSRIIYQTVHANMVNVQYCTKEIPIAEQVC